MQSKAALLAQQIAWARDTKRQADAKGYLESVESNLFRPLSQSARAAFERGSGSELLRSRSRPAKMAALHSSSALAVNVFDHWSGRSLATIAVALGLKSAPDRFMFEAQFPTGLEGNPPNLDIAFYWEDAASVLGVESKFSEWLTPKSPRKEAFKPKYFAEGQTLWSDVGLDGAQTLVDDLRSGREQFRYLDAPQLLKHMLGLASSHRSMASLCYLFYEWPGRESPLHLSELGRFAKRIGSDMAFHWLSYQDLFARLRIEIGSQQDPHADYLAHRYFRSAV